MKNNCKNVKPMDNLDAILAAAGLGVAFSLKMSDNNHGGHRNGAGRPKTNDDLVKIPVSYRLPRWLVEWMRSQDAPQSILIEDAIRSFYNLTEIK